MMWNRGSNRPWPKGVQEIFERVSHSPGEKRYQAFAWRDALAGQPFDPPRRQIVPNEEEVTFDALVARIGSWSNFTTLPRRPNGRSSSTSCVGLLTSPPTGLSSTPTCGRLGGRNRVGAERPRRRADAEAGRAPGRGLRGRGCDRRRRSHGGADPAGISARPVLGDPPGGARLAVLPLGEPRRAVGRAAAVVAHPLDDGTAVVLERDIADVDLGADTDAYHRLVGPIVEKWERAEPLVLGPFPPPFRAVAEGARLAPSAVAALRDAVSVAQARFRTDRGRALFAGLAAHSMLPLERRPSAGFGMALAVLGHVGGFGFPRGGAQAITDALAAELNVRASSPVDELPEAEDPPRRRRALGAPPHRAAAGAVRPPPRAVPPRPRGVQARLGARRADPLARERVRAGRDRPHRRHAGGDRGIRAGSVDAGARRAAVPDPRPAHAVRPDPGARGEAHRVGVLPRSERLEWRPDGRDRGAGRALRAGLPRARPRAGGDDAGRLRGAEPQLRRRGHQRRCAWTSGSCSHGRR